MKVNPVDVGLSPSQDPKPRSLNARSILLDSKSGGLPYNAMVNLEEKPTAADMGEHAHTCSH